MPKQTTQSNGESCFRTSIGGQALIEGIYMRGPDKQLSLIHILDSLIRYPLVRLKMDEYARFSSQHWRQEYPDAYVRKYIVVNHYHSYLNIVKHDYAFMVGNKWQISELEKMDIQSVRFSSLKHKVHLMILKKEFIPFSREAKQFLHLFKNSYGLDKV